MSANTGVWLEDLTWPEAKARFEAGMPVVIPIGAASKAHGPHLPLKTDALTARAEVDRAPARDRSPRRGFRLLSSLHLLCRQPASLVRHLQGVARRAFGQPARPRRQPHRPPEHRRLDRKADRRSGRRRD